MTLSSFDQFSWLKKCKVTTGALTTILKHMESLIHDFEDRFTDIIAMEFPLWIAEPFAINLSDVELEYQYELAELQSNKVLESAFRNKGTSMWLANEVGIKYPRCSLQAKKNTRAFPLIECGFSAVNNLVTAKRNRLEITQRGDLRLKLTSLEPQIKKLCSRQMAQFSH